MKLTAPTGERLISVDSNVMVHSATIDAGFRHPIAVGIVAALSDKGSVLSTQALTEFFNVASKEHKLGAEAAQRAVEGFMGTFTIVRPSPEGVRSAMKLVRQHSLSIHDAMLLATLSRAGCRIFLTGNWKLARIRQFRRTRIINPYSEGFDLQSLLEEAAELERTGVPANVLYGASRNQSASAVPHRLVLPFSPEVIRAVLPFLKREPGGKPSPSGEDDGDDGPGPRDACITIEF